MNPLDEARANVERAFLNLGTVLQSRLQPDALQQEARNFQAAADSWADVKREHSRGGA